MSRYDGVSAFGERPRFTGRTRPMPASQKKPRAKRVCHIHAASRKNFRSAAGDAFKPMTRLTVFGEV